ncbi:MAG: DUF433 domain-containing protein [Chloroflexi bacterium]|nr:DUF433 domain-containing protein [Chloroflexota bacterium]
MAKRTGRTTATNETLITRSDDRAWGAAVFSGTRVPVDVLFEYIEAGETLDEFLRQFPTVSRAQAVGVLEAARRQARHETLPV